MNKKFNFKKLAKYFIFSLAILMVCFSVGCKKKEKPIEKPKAEIVLVDTTMSIKIGEVKKINFELKNDETNKGVQFEASSDIVTVSQKGEVTGVASGIVNVKIIYGGDKNIYKTVAIEVVDEIKAIDYVIGEAIKEDLWVGKKLELEIITNGARNLLNFESTDENIVSVDEKGVIEAKGVGNATIVVYAKNDESKVAYINVEVKELPTSLTLRTKDRTTYVGKKISLKFSTSPSGAVSSITWTSSDEAIIKVDASGVIEAVGVGSATIKGVSTVNKDAFIEFTMEVLQPATSIEVVGMDQTNIYIGESIQLSTSVYPSTVLQDVTYKSSKSDVATISDSGLIEAKERGTTLITISSKLTPEVTKSFMLTVEHPLLETENNDVNYIITGPGEDSATMVTINYHGWNTKSVVELTKKEDTEFKSAKEYKPNGVYFEELSEELNGPFPARNVFSIEIENLEPNTEYMYRIKKGDNTYSDSYHFKTAKQEAEDFSFVWLTDNHYNALYDGAETSENIIHEAMKMRDHISFVLDTGDMIDTGGNSEIWDIMFEKRQTLKELPMISTTGNHELYVASTAQWDNRFHAAYNALPKNGVVGKVGTSCFFVYNQVLFLMIENVAASSYTEQLEWMEELIKTGYETGQIKMVIAGMHAPIQSEDPSNAKSDRDEKMMAVFEKYGVELVLTGHYHSHRIDRNYYQGVRTNDLLLGTNYMIGRGSGAKGASGASQEELNNFANGYIVDIKGTTITVTRIDGNGKVLSTDSFSSIKYEEVKEEAKNTSKDEIVNSLTHTFNSNTGDVELTWTKNAYGNVQKIVFEELNRKENVSEIYIISESYQKALLKSWALTQYDTKIKATFFFKDGTTKEKVVEIDRSNSLNIKADYVEKDVILFFDEVHTSLKYKVKNVAIYINGELQETVKYSDSGSVFTYYRIENADLTKSVVVEFVYLGSKDETIMTDSIELK